jgi:hypothetical protein
VDGTQAQSIRILGADESHAVKGAWLVALGQAYDDQSRQIYGVEFTWDVDGQEQTGWYGNAGDLYRYKFDPAKPAMLAANYNGMAAVAQIHSGGGFVDSSNHIGCSAAPGKPGSPWWILIFALILYPLRMSRYMRHDLLPGSSASTDSHSARASSFLPTE